MSEDNYINEQLLKQVSEQQKVSIAQIQAVLKLIEEGGTVPFIARYRKEVTGGLDEEQIRAIYQEWEYGRKLADRKEDIMRLIEEKGKLTEELKEAIIKANKLSELEDIYRPFKEKKKTRATEAKRRGLEPLALYLLSFPVDGDVLEEAKKYVTVDATEEMVKDGLVVKDEADALQGAKDIIAEMVSDDAKFRRWIRNFLQTRGELVSQVKDQAVDEKQVYEMYYDYREPVSSIKLHRVLAINRGEAEKVLKVSISEDTERVIKFLNRRVIENEESISAPYVQEAIEDGYRRLIKPSIEREIRAELKEKAEDQAIKIFAENLKRYLLTPPMKGKVVLGVDPAYRTGCKLAVVDTTGKVLTIDKIYPNQKSKEEVISDERTQREVDKIKTLVDRYAVEVIAIGNGTASRETESFIADALKQIDKEVYYIIVNEAGASIYSASDLAREEFPDYAVEERSAVSIARRLQDPLSELVKIDPKSIGVGQYQYDVSQSKLNNSLDFVVETAVNSVGVNINSASVPLLQRVSGLNLKTAKTLVEYRDQNGEFKNREEIKIKGIGPKTLEQAIGFLRIPDGDEKLDMTSIHPESYGVAEEILEKLGFSKDDIGSVELQKKIAGLNRKEFIKEFTVGEYTFNDILDAFVAPLRDPRDSFEKPILRSDVLHLEDLKPGMELQGTVRNVVDFGAFVDCGVKEDGLVHLSRMSKKFIKHPLDVVSVGDIVKVWVVSVDLLKGRVELSMIPPMESRK
ncbi:MAG TPA: Tex family protein [Bacilli bacterium]|nr:Tex family protein [Bacilli bacterium]HOR17332.1 Tex family protein [Bacilli bacterium]HPL54938.1 Tex family protein [Bacilli bacterium]